MWKKDARCKDCNYKGMVDDKGIMFCNHKNIHVWQGSLPCNDFDDTTIF